MITQLFYIPGALQAQTALIEKDGGLVCAYFGKTLAKRLDEDPDGVVVSIDEALDLIEKATVAAFCKPPVETTEDRFLEMLEALPPQGWTKYRGVEMFYMSEALCGTIHQWFFRAGKRFFTMDRPCYATNADLVQEIAPLLT